MQEDALPSSQGEDPEGFDPWLSAVTTTYRALGNDERNYLLKHLIANSEPYQLNFLSTHVPSLTCRDFISFLPFELIGKILKRLTGRQLLLIRLVCKRWRDRINSLVDVWQDRAFEVGVNIQSIQAKYLLDERAEPFRELYCMVEQFLLKLQRERISVGPIDMRGLGEYRDSEDTDFCFTKDYIIIGNSDTGEVDVYSVKYMDLKVSVYLATSFNAALLHVGERVFVTNRGGSFYSHRIDLPDSSDEENEPYADIPRMHSYTGHTSVVWGLDAKKAMGDTFVISGSFDKTVKIWLVPEKEKEAELFMTLDKHISRVTEVYYLPSMTEHVLRFISCGTKEIYVWAVNVNTMGVRQHHVEVPDGVASFCFDIAKPDLAWASVWNFDQKQSKFSSYRLAHKDDFKVKIEEEKEWRVNVYGFKAKVLACGSRFAFLVCSISLQDFIIFDLVAGYSLVKFAINNRFMNSTFQMYDTAWLDGFQFIERKRRENDLPTLIGAIRGCRMAALVLDLPGRKGIYNEYEKGYDDGVSEECNGSDDWTIEDAFATTTDDDQLSP